MEYSMLVVTCPNSEVAEAIARHLVDHRLAACGNVTAPVTSVYRWKGKVHRDSEVILFLKTRRNLVRKCVQAVRPMHPYELPEILALPIAGGLPPYLSWITAETRGARTSRPRPR